MHAPRASMPGWRARTATFVRDLAVEDLRHLVLEEPLHERLVGAADDDLRAAERAAHLEHDHLAVLADEVALVRRLLAARQDGLGLAELHDRGAGVEAADLPVDDVALAVRVLREDLLALGLTQRLLDDLLCGLRADAAEGRGRLLERHDVAELRIGLDALRGLQLDLELGVLDLLDHGLEEVDLERAGGDVDLDVDVLFSAVRALERARDDVADDFLGKTLLSGELCETGDELSVHASAPPSSIPPTGRRRAGDKKSGVDPLFRLPADDGKPADLGEL